MNKLDNIIQSELDLILDPEGDYIQGYWEHLGDNYAAYSDRWTRAIEATLNPDWQHDSKSGHLYPFEGISNKEMDQVIDAIIHGLDDLVDIEITYTLSRPRREHVAIFPIGSIEIQLPEGLTSYESDDYHISEHSGTHYAQGLVDEIVAFTLDRSKLIEFLEDIREEAA